jgi:hypothetical protein
LFLTSVAHLPIISFVVEDEAHNYISARFPGDTEKMAQRMVEVVKSFA